MKKFYLKDHERKHSRPKVFCTKEEYLAAGRPDFIWVHEKPVLAIGCRCRHAFTIVLRKLPKAWRDIAAREPYAEIVTCFCQGSFNPS